MSTTFLFWTLASLVLLGLSLLLAAAGAQEHTPRARLARALGEFWLTVGATVGCLILAGRMGWQGSLPATVGLLLLGSSGLSRTRWLIATGLGLRPEVVPRRGVGPMMAEVVAITGVGLIAIFYVLPYFEPALMAAWMALGTQ